MSRQGSSAAPAGTRERQHRRGAGASSTLGTASSRADNSLASRQGAIRAGIWSGRVEAGRSRGWRLCAESPAQAALAHALLARFAWGLRREERPSWSQLASRLPLRDAAEAQSSDAHAGHWARGVLRAPMQPQTQPRGPPLARSGLRCPMRALRRVLADLAPGLCGVCRLAYQTEPSGTLITRMATLTVAALQEHSSGEVTSG